MTEGGTPRAPAAPAASSLQGAAKGEFDRCVADFAKALLAEAQRLEAGQSSSGTPEITSTMVRDANMLVRKNYHRPKKSAGYVASNLIAGAALVVVGVATNHLDKQWAQIVFPIAVVVALTAGMFVWTREAS
jgi:hypothetical protein